MHLFYFFLDVSEIENDQRRMEHFSSLVFVIKSFFGHMEGLSEEYLLELFGKVQYIISQQFVEQTSLFASLKSIIKSNFQRLKYESELWILIFGE